MTTRLPACLVLLAALLASGCGSDSRARASAPADPPAAVATWRTWTLASAEDVAVSPPPAKGSPAARHTLASARAAVAARTDAESRRLKAEAAEYAVQPWLDRAMELVSRRPKDPVTASRDYALVAVAMEDAAVAAAHWQQRYPEPAIGGASLFPGESGYPSVRAAIAGAGSRVIAYAFPEYPDAQLDQDAERAAHDLVAGGAARAADAAAGLALGRAVAKRAIAVGRRDGSDRRWHGRVPHAPGSWAPPPGSAARPVSPGAGTWRTWVLSSGGADRPPPPPAYGSPEFRAQAQAVLDTARHLTAHQKYLADFWAGGEGTELPPGRWMKVTLGYLRDQPAMSQARAARIFALLTTAMADGGVASWDAKYHWWVARPENAIRDLGLDRHFKPYLKTPFFPSYTSGHAVYSGAAAEVLAYLFPADAALWRRRAREAAMSRVYGGIHYPMDSTAGLPMGERIGRLVVARARADGADR